MSRCRSWHSFTWGNQGMTSKAGMKMKTLFIGNSFTARNNLPELVAQLAAACGQELQHQLIQAGGASLRMHWNKGDAQKAIKKTQYDYVVQLEQSTLPSHKQLTLH